MELNTARDALKECNMFHGLNQSQLGLLLMTADVRNFSVDEIVYLRGENSYGTFALVVSGKVNVVADDDHILDQLGRGEVMGEVGSISQQGTRTATVVAVKPTEIMEWRLQSVGENFPELLKKLKDLAWRRIKNWY